MEVTDDEVRWWKKLLYILKNPSSVITSVEDIVSKTHYAYCDLAVVNKFWEYWKKVDSILNKFRNLKDELKIKAIKNE